MSKTILTIEDDRLVNQLIAEHLRRMGHMPQSALSWKDAQHYLETNEPDLILMDVRLPDANGMDLLPEIASEHAVIVITAFASVKDAVKAMQAGVEDYIIKPVSQDELEIIVQRTLDNIALRDEHQFCKQRMQARDSRKLMIGDSSVMQKVFNLINAVAVTDMTVLIQGESGVGKELVAKTIHDRSSRSERNFVTVDCCTLQENLFESELFGHEKGAFTGANRQKKGLIEAAEGGTLFLDEIGEISISTQAKLLRVLETGQFRRVGGTRNLLSNVRIVAATNRNLEEMSQNGDFRADLFYRLDAFPIDVPPLRERRKDIPSLVTHFIHNHNFSKNVKKSVTATAMKQFVAYDWPGNIRELKNIVERAIILSRDKRQITSEHLSFLSSKSGSDYKFTLDFTHEPTMPEIEKKYFQFLMERYSGNRAMIASRMGISERSVYRMIEKYGTYKTETTAD